MMDELIGGIIILLMLALMFGFYFLPTIIAYYLEKLPARMGLILTVNLFFGWTVIGWILAWVLVITGRFKEVKQEDIP